MKRALSLALVLALVLSLAVVWSGAEDKAVDVILLLDRSSAMSDDGGAGRRMPAAREAAKNLINRILDRSSARVAVIAFDDEATVASPFRTVKTLLRSAVNVVTRSDDAANLEAALLRAEKLFNESGRAAAEKAVIIISAGEIRYYNDKYDEVSLGLSGFMTESCREQTLDQAHLFRDTVGKIYSVAISPEQTGYAFLCAAQDGGYFTGSGSASELADRIFAAPEFDAGVTGDCWSVGFAKRSLIPEELTYLTYEASELPQTGLLYDPSVINYDLSFDRNDLPAELQALLAELDLVSAGGYSDGIVKSVRSFINRVLPIDPPFNPAAMLACSASFAAELPVFYAQLAAAKAGTGEPVDYSAALSNYYMAGYKQDWYAAGYLDAPSARAVALNDNTGRGDVVLVALETVGFSRAHVNQLRDDLAVFAYENGIREINIMADHNHATIDTFGIWGPILGDGKDAGYMELVFESVRQAVVEACQSKKDGALYAGTADAALETGYAEPLVQDTRYPYVTDNANIITRFRFVPEDGSQQLYIVHFGAHLEALQGVNNCVSADFLKPFADYLAGHGGAEYIYFTGAIGGLIRTTKDITLPQSFAPRNEKHKYYEITKQVGSRLGALVCGISNEAELAAELNLSGKTFEAPLDNYLLAAYANLGFISTRVYVKNWRTGMKNTAETVAATKTLATAGVNALATYAALKAQGGLETDQLMLRTFIAFADTYWDVAAEDMHTYASTEMHYYAMYEKTGGAEHGLLLLPGEIFGELVYGGLLTDETADNPGAQNPRILVDIAADFGKSYGEDNRNLVVVGQSNDMIGYIIPPNDFLLSPTAPYINGNKTGPGRSHYEETNSTGIGTAQLIADTFAAVLAAQ